MPRGRKPKHQPEEEATKIPTAPPEPTAEEKAAFKRKMAEKYLFEDEGMKVVFNNLKTAAEAGNPVARTLYGLYHLFIGSNIMEKQDESYAEAVKWFYLNRRGELESNMLQNLINNTMPSHLVNPEQVYDNALRMAALAKDAKNSGYIGTIPKKPALY